MTSQLKAERRSPRRSTKGLGDTSKAEHEDESPIMLSGGSNWKVIGICYYKRWNHS